MSATLKSWLALCIFLACVVASAIAADEDSADQARAREREKNRGEMRERAVAAKVRLIAGDAKPDAELQKEPVLHYTDQPRRITDATLWVWTIQGRPAALCKIEKYDHPQPERTWLYCFGSLSTGRIEFQARDGHQWSAKEAGLALQRLPDGPEPAPTAPGRLRQIKGLAQRLAGTMLDDVAKVSQEMRLLPQPLYRYAAPDLGVIDGALFGLTTNGTNPDALFVIELHKAGSAAPHWELGVAGMTQGNLSVKLDGKEVWSKPHVPGPGDFSTWTWFWEKPKDERRTAE